MTATGNPVSQTLTAGMTLADLTVGSTLASWEDLRILIEDHAVKRKISFFCKPKDGMRANYICRQEKEGCPFRVYAILNDMNGEINNSKN